MSEDLIRRSDAIAEIYKVRTPDVASHHYAELFINAVYRAPSAYRPQCEWIPCSERLPDEYDEYLCQYDDGDMIVGWLENEEWCKKNIAKEKIIAWRPLPEPYKKGDREMIIAECTPSDGCQNQKETWDMLCVKCGKCGRIFNEEGMLVKRPPTCNEILDRLKEHYEECEAYWNNLIEADADWLMIEKACTRVSAVDECINLVRSVMEG